MSRMKELVAWHWPLAGIAGLGLVLRMWSIGFGLPYTVASDEPTFLLIMLRMLNSGDLNPHWWLYPSLMFYIYSLGLLALFLVGRVLGMFSTLSDLPYPEIVTMGVGKLALPAEYLVTRGLTAIFSAAGIILVYLIVRRLTDKRWGALLAAMLYAVSPSVFDQSRTINPDVFALFFSLLSLLFAIQVTREPRLRYYVLAGAGAGLAAASKYNAGFVLAALVIAHLLYFGGAGWRRKELLIGIGAAAAAFFIGTPFSFFDFQGFWEGMRVQAYWYAMEGHAGQEGDALTWYISYLWNKEGQVALLALLGGVYFLFRRHGKNLVVFLPAVLYFLFVSLWLIRNARTIMQIVPFLDILAALVIVLFFDWLTHSGRVPILPGKMGLLAVSAFLIIPPLLTAWQTDIRLMQTDGRDSARQWIETNLPRGTRIAEEAYSPYIDTARYTVQGINAIVDREPDWYLSNGFEYLVFSQGMFSRFVDDPKAYPDLAAKYNSFFDRFQQVAQFDDNGFRVLVYKTNVELPAHRVAARFGNDGEIVELIGYDATPTWVAGSPLRITLLWRTVNEAPQPLQFSLSLLGQDDRAVAQVRDDLFQGKGWRAGMFATEWIIPTSEDLMPGPYRLEISVLQSRYAYPLPAQTWRAERIDPVLLSPIKMGVAQPTAAELEFASSANVTFGDEIELIGFKSSSSVVTGGNPLSLTLYWRSLAKRQNDYTVFVHLIDAAGQVKAQVDLPPRGGTYPTSLWDAGEVVPDSYELRIPSDVAPGDYRIELGIYRYDTLARLMATNTQGQAIGDHWFLPATVTIR